ncbi:hypothetical protein [Prevotella sp. KH2C16]|uniref:hypothetical protein n=1 Tax=Prevotella sp. KH2C16 TaxID=1855325 RepID=UPI0008E79D4E|nr:hypothetical protein [Prevotella sp. KH2C16]SFG70178.1 hypothetical protein SAMN05216383_13016 [Prevotella sp. KH2C16]
MRTDKDIERLLERYMQGETTPQEEAQLANYFAHTEVKEKWKPYQEMFAFLGKMDGKGHPEAPRRKTRAVFVSILSAAAVGLLLFTLWPRDNDKTTSQPPKQSVLAQSADSTATVKTDTASRKTGPEKTKQPAKKRMRHETPRPPKSYMAQTETTSPQEKADRLVEQKLHELERKLATADKTIDLYILQQELLTAQMIENEETENIYE